MKFNFHTPAPPKKGNAFSARRARLNQIIFGADTPLGKAFDIVLIVSILASVVVVMLDSIKSLDANYGQLFDLLEWGFTILFTIEYILRLSCVGRPTKYAFSFFGIIDLLAVLPTYVSLLFPGTHFLAVIRVLRVLRVFRVLKLVQYLNEVEHLNRSLRASRRKITVFLFSVGVVVVIVGSLMYVIEGEANGFTSIPRSIYWSIVTLTTVGYGDISPQTPIGQAFAALIMILGYGIIAVPTGIVTAEMTRNRFEDPSEVRACAMCSSETRRADAVFCRICGTKL